MKFGMFQPPMPPPMFTMTFTRDEGWAIAMALKDAADNYKEAKERKEWARWAYELEQELKR